MPVPSNAEELNQLVRQYAPIVYFHPEEQYLVCDVEWFRSQATLKNAQTGAIVTMSGLPTDPDGKDKYYLTAPASVHAGNLAGARAMVNAKLVGDGIFLDLQYWFFYAYNGGGRLKAWPAADVISLAPLGQHEGDWEHITLRFRADTMALVSVYMSQHDGGEWFKNPASELEWQSGRPVVYSSLNGHASYAHADSNLSHRSHIDGVYDVGLRNDTARGGSSLDFLDRCVVISTNFLTPFDAPEWLKYTGRFGEIRHYLPPSVPSLSSPLKEAVEGVISALPDEVKGESGPEGPARKGCWPARWTGDDEAVCPPWLPGSGFVVLRRSQPMGSGDPFSGGSQLWRVFSDGTQWSYDAQIPCGMSENPSAVVYNGHLYVFHQGYNNNGELWYTVFDGKQWSNDTKVPLGMSGSPSAVVYNGKIYVFHQGYNNNGELWYVVFDGKQWSNDMNLGAGLSESPSAVVYNGRLYVFHQGYKNSGDLWHMAFDGSGWSGDTPLGAGLSASPSAVVHNGNLYCFHEGSNNSGEVWYMKFNGQSWSKDTRAPIGTSSGVSTMVYDGKIYVFHQGYQNSRTLWCATFDGNTWGSDIEFPDIRFTGAPFGVVWRARDPIPNGTYKLISAASGKVLDVNGGSTADGANLIQYSYGGGANQHWTFAYQGNGCYRITSVSSGKALDVPNGSTASGVNLIQWPWKGGDNQLWQVTDNGDGTYLLTSKLSGKAMDVSGGSTADGALVIQWPRHGGVNQKWLIKPV